MQYGVCMNLVDFCGKGELDERLFTAAAAGFTYVETNAAACAGATEAELAAIKKALAGSGLACKRACVLFPGRIKVVGPEADEKEIRGYIGALLPKLAGLGVEVAVFGSGGARRVPGGFSSDEAFSQFCACARIVAEMGAAHGVKVALEHLNPKETNLLTTVGEAVKAARQAAHPSCGLLFDFYHADPTSNDLEQVCAGRDILFHSHVALPGSRLYPAPGDEDALRPYFAILKKSGYDGTVSVEAGLREDRSYEENLAGAYRLLTALAAE